MQVDFGGSEDIAFFKEGRAGIIRLTRVKALNSLNQRMVDSMFNALTHWETDDDIACILVESEGRAFCAGGDVVAAYHNGKAGRPAFDYFETEYRLNAFIGRFPKPYVSFLNGITMGGGAGISVHGSHRIVTENTVFAMPESAIGFFPDVGSSAFLPHLPNAFGMYLALTGAKIKWGDCLQTGIATHAMKAEDYPVLRQALVTSGNPRPALEQVGLEIDYETSIEIRTLIGDCFTADSVEACVEKLKAKAAEGNAFAADCVKTILTRSPTTLKVAFKELNTCRPLALNDCLVIENRISHHMLEGNDFYEGVRAVLVDKDNTPVWQPATLEEITPDMVESYFAPLEHELQP